MKKIVSFVLVFIFAIALTPMQAFADEGDVMLSIQAQVDSKIGSRGAEVMVTVLEVDTRQEYEILLYPENNYHATEYIAPGNYKVIGLYVSGTIDSFMFDRPRFKADGQTVEVKFKVGNGDWDGVNNGYTNGMLDREKINQVLIEKGEDPIDWEKIDADTSNWLETEEVETSEVDTDKENPGEDSAGSSETVEPADTSKTPETTETDNTEKDEKDKKNEEDPGSPSKVWVTIIFIGVVLGGTIGFVIYKRIKYGVPFGTKRD